MTSRLSEVAKYAGVSEATVSRVLRNKPGTSQSTRDAVLTALDVFGFERPTRMRSERSSLIGLVLPDLRNPIFPAFAEVMAGALVKRGLVPVLCTRTADGVSEAHYIEMLLAQNVGGIIFVGGSFADAGPEHCRVLRERKVPIVLINAADENLGVPRVCVDDAVAVEQAMGHLAALGHTDVGLILGPVGHVPSARKYAAFREFCEGSTRHPRWRELIVNTIFSAESGRSAATRLIADGATAVVCASDALALGAVRAARKLGLSVPEDLSVVGFDDSAFMGATDPPLTTVRQPIGAMGAAAIASLISQIDGGAVSSDEMLFDPELIVRSSTGPRRIVTGR